MYHRYNYLEYRYHAILYTDYIFPGQISAAAQFLIQLVLQNEAYTKLFERDYLGYTSSNRIKRVDFNANLHGVTWASCLKSTSLRPEHLVTMLPISTEVCYTE